MTKIIVKKYTHPDDVSAAVDEPRVLWRAYIPGYLPGVVHGHLTRHAAIADLVVRYQHVLGLVITDD